MVRKCITPATFLTSVRRNDVLELNVEVMDIPDEGADKELAGRTNSQIVLLLVQCPSQTSK